GKEGLSEPLSTVSEEGLTVAAYRAQGEKCARCWKYTGDVGKDSQYVDLCGFCADVVSRL
ncbi:MAG TPA: zinc finger domain-containing protein, partial [Candidatus Obscuribacter sp.]|nr:zinc finger domain-containing protein [Candidatus Obscuribacter sp.]